MHTDAAETHVIDSLASADLGAYLPHAQLCALCLRMDKADAEAHLLTRVGMKRGHMRRFMGNVWAKTPAHVKCSDEEDALGALVAPADETIPQSAGVAIIRAGVAGLTVAAAFIGDSTPVIVLEKRARVGFFNAAEKAPAYAWRRPQHGAALALLQRTQQAVKGGQHVRIYTNTLVKSATRSGEGWLLRGCRQAEQFATACGFVVIASSGCLSPPRHLLRASDESRVLWGLGATPSSCTSKRVVIIGMSAFALDNMRAAITHRATSVTFLTRRRGTVCPQVINVAHMLHRRAGSTPSVNAILFSYLKKAYDAARIAHPECWHAEKRLAPVGRDVVVSDLFFVASWLQAVTTQVGEAAEIVDAGVLTRAGTQVEADVVIQCAGFELDDGAARISGESRSTLCGMIAPNMWLQLDPHRDADPPVTRHDVPSTLIAQYWRDAQLCTRARAAGIVQPQPDTGILEDEEDTLEAQCVANKRAWLDAHALVRQGVGQTLAYPFEHMATELASVSASARTDDAPSRPSDTAPPRPSAAAPTRVPAASMHTLMHVAARLVTCDTLDPDTPLMDAGLDSLGAMELHSELQTITSSKLPATLVLDAPTLRLIDSHLLQHTRAADTAAPSATPTVLHEDLLRAAKRLITSERLDTDTPLMDAGLDSLGAMELQSELETLTSTAMPATLVLDAPTLRSIARHIEQRAPAAHGALDTGIAASPAAPPDDAAQRQCACEAITFTLPADVCRHASFSRLAFGAGCVVAQVPAARWEAPGGLSAPEAARVRHGGFVDAAEWFDHTHFGVSVNEACAMDPQQRLLLESGYSALRHAGKTRDTLAGSGTPVFTGMEYFDFAEVAPDNSFRHDSGGMAAGRASYVLGLTGPCALIGTTCSSALVAASMACTQLQCDNADTALASAASLMLRPRAHLIHARSGGLSTSGRCHTFDARADGFARSEAVLGVALGVAPAAHTIASHVVRCDGRSASFTAPSGLAQREMLRAARASCTGVIAYEAHGTGTALGDPTEVGGVVEVFGSNGGSVVFGSVKANTGHVEPGAGAAGLLAIMSQLHAQSAHPNAALRTLNPHIQSAVSQCTTTFSQLATPLPQALMCGTSAFGINGTIAHVMLRASCGGTANSAPAAFAYRRRRFPWDGSAHTSSFGEARGPTLDSDTPLMSAGINSQMAITLAARIQAASKCERLGSTLLFEHATARAIAAHVQTTTHNPFGADEVIALASGLMQRGTGCHTGTMQFETETLRDPPTLLPRLDDGAYGDRVVELSRGKDGHLPLFVMHTPDGLTSVFLGLSRALRHPNPVFGVEHAIIRSGDDRYLQNTDVIHLGSEYSADVLNVCTAREYTQIATMGASFGAALAHTTTCAISARAPDMVRVLVLIDPPPPGLNPHRAKGTLNSSVQWRRIAAATLLERSSIVAGREMSTDECMCQFEERVPDDINVVFAMNLVRLGMIPAGLASARDCGRRLDAWVHCATSLAHSTWGETRVDLRANVVLVSATERCTFFDGSDTMAMEKYFGVDALAVTGSHLQVLALCAGGASDEFNARLNSQLCGFDLPKKI